MRYTRWLWLVIFPLALALSTGKAEAPLSGETAALAAASANGGAWQQVNTPSGPGNRVGHSLTVIDNVPYLFGGVTPAGPQNDIHMIRPAPMVAHSKEDKAWTNRRVWSSPAWAP